MIGDIASKAPDLNFRDRALPYGAIGLPVNLYVSAEGVPNGPHGIMCLQPTNPTISSGCSKNVGWLPNRHNVDYTPVTEAEPAFAAFVDYPEGYAFFTLPRLRPARSADRIAAQLVNALCNARACG